MLTYSGIWCIHHFSDWVECLSGGIFPSDGLLEFLLGVAALVIVFVTVFRFEAVSFEDSWKTWEKIRDREQNNKIAYNAQTAFDEIRQETITVDFLTKIKWVLSGKKPCSAKNKGEDDCREKD